MPRKPRIEFPGALYHVISRGNQRKNAFFGDEDYNDYLNRLWNYHKKFEFVLYAYCLMPNHVHLLIEVGETPLSKIMHGLQFSYTQSFNRRHRKVGHLFQGRYKAILCQKDEYLLQLIRYIHLNPIRAKIAKNPKDYQWSSHRCLIGKVKDSKCDRDKTLGLFGKYLRKAAANYSNFVMSAVDEGHNEDYYRLKDQRILGDDNYVFEVLATDSNDDDVFYHSIDIDDIVKQYSDEFGVAYEVLRSPSRTRLASLGRGVVTYVAKTITNKSLSDVGQYFKMSEVAIGKRYRDLLLKMSVDNKLCKKVTRFCNKLKLQSPAKIKSKVR